jgi:hypothetical protein
MKNKIITLGAILLAVVGWWGLYELTGVMVPDQPSAQTLFYALLFLAITGTLVPPAAFLNRRFAPQLVKRDSMRFLRHAAWAGLCLTSWAWLQTHRIFNVAFALVIAMVFVAIEVMITRMRTAESAPET